MNDIMDLLFWQIKRHPDIVEDLEGKCRQYLSERGVRTDDAHAKRMALTVIRKIGRGENDIRKELQEKNKFIFCTTTSEALFITTDKPFVRFNRTANNGIAVPGTEMYYPLTSRMLLFMRNNGKKREFKVENRRKTLRDLNTYIARAASRYLFGSSEEYLARIIKNMGFNRAQS